eukprot:gene7893-9712_t
MIIFNKTFNTLFKLNNNKLTSTEQQQSNPTTIDIPTKVDSKTLLEYKEPVRNNSFTLEELTREKKWYHSLLGIYSKNTLSLHNSYSIYSKIANQTSNPKFYNDNNLPITVRSWFAVTCLHVWMVLVRFRKDGKLSNQLTSDLYDRFWDDLEKRIILGGIKPRHASKYLKLFYTNYLGSVVSYDEGLFDDTIMANAIWRNLYGMNENVSATELLSIVKYIRFELNHLDQLPDVTSKGEISFHDPTTIFNK